MYGSAPRRLRAVGAPRLRAIGAPRLLLALASTLVLGACASSPMANAPMVPFSQMSLPDAVKVPAGHRVAMETVGVGSITYECRDRANAAGQEWAFVGPDATLQDRAGRRIGRYYGPPATWEGSDGSRLTGSQVAVAPAGAGDIPLQLVRAAPPASGAMAGMTYIQRVATRGGVAPAMPCDAAAPGKREVVTYQADFFFYRAG
jgi:hypothetical protein